MAIDGSYLQMQLQIADELGDRPDLMVPSPTSNLTTSPIQRAIQSAIAMWERKDFYFNEVDEDNWFTTVQGQEIYSAADEPSIATVVKLIKVITFVSANRYTLTARTWQYLEDISVNPAAQTSLIVDYAYLGEKIRFYPIPAGAYPIGRTAVIRLDPLVNDNDANAWTQDAYDLIRCQAKLIMAREILYDSDMAQAMTASIYGSQGEPGYLRILMGENTTRGGGAGIRPTSF